MPNPVCSRCSENILEKGDSVGCAKCGDILHFYCAGFSDTNFRKLSTDKKTKWTCSACKTTSKAPEVATSIYVTQAQMEEKLCKELQLINEKLNVLPTLKNNVDTLQKSLDFLSAKYDELILQHKKSEEENKILKQKVEKLEHSERENQRVIETMSHSFHELEQYTRNRNIEIHGLDNSITTGNDTELRKTVTMIGKKIGVEDMEESDIDVVHPLPSRMERAPTVIIQFKSRTIRTKWLIKRRTPLLNRDLAASGSSERIYINENLSPFYRNLFWRARQKAREFNYRFVWVRDGKIFVKKDESSNAIRIQFERQIEDMRNSV